jgi:2-keto-4-pentenoate hydratase/2-oxohepta-3-ene-1,7-dioic acid hydratase in catechol pathway
MHLVMFMKDKQPRAGVIDGEDIIDINACDHSLPPTLKGILEINGISRIGKIIKSKKHRVPRKRVKLLPPIANPGLLLSVGMNYHEHLKEMKTPVPERPAAFTKSVASIIASGDSIVLPASHPDMVDWEGEFTVVSTPLNCGMFRKFDDRALRLKLRPSLNRNVFCIVNCVVI